jgi:hypothetical protein
VISFSCLDTDSFYCAPWGQLIFGMRNSRLLQSLIALIGKNSNTTDSAELLYKRCNNLRNRTADVCHVCIPEAGVYIQYRQLIITEPKTFPYNNN